MLTQLPQLLFARLAVLTLVLLSATALAFDGLTIGVGLGLPSEGAVPINIRASYPVYSFELSDYPIDLRVRLDATTASSFNAVPTIAVTGIAIANAGEVYPYLGLGGALSFVPLGPVVPLFSAQMLFGVQIPISSGFSASLEGALATNAHMTNAQLILAVDYTPLGDNKPCAR